MYRTEGIDKKKIDAIEGERLEKEKGVTSRQRGIFLKRSDVKAVRALGSNRGEAEIGRDVMKKMRDNFWTAFFGNEFPQQR